MAKLSFAKRPRFFVPALIILLVIAVLAAVVHNMGQPAVGSINETPPAQAEKTDPYAQPGTYTGKYISFRYPAHYKKIPSALTGSTLEVIEYHTTDITGKIISISVYKGSLDDDSNISFRRQHKELYTENDSSKWIEFTKKDSTEDTFFIGHNGLVASISATAPYSDQSGDASFVASSLKWNQ